MSLGGPGFGMAPVGPEGTNHAVGSTDEQVGTFMHEFGHNLGLGHGGEPADVKNCEPNYLSIMSLFISIFKLGFEETLGLLTISTSNPG